MKTRSGLFLDLGTPILCLVLAFFACNFGDKSPAANDSKTPSSTPTTSKKQSAVGVWVGKAYDGRTELKMAFTTSDWSLIAKGKLVMTRPYTLKDDGSIEVRDTNGDILPITLRLDGDLLRAETKDGSTTLKRQD